jgi:hypothetical protein
MAENLRKDQGGGYPDSIDANMDGCSIIAVPIDV